MAAFHWFCIEKFACSDNFWYNVQTNLSTIENFYEGCETLEELEARNKEFRESNNNTIPATLEELQAYHERIAENDRLNKVTRAEWGKRYEENTAKYEAEQKQRDLEWAEEKEKMAEFRARVKGFTNTISDPAPKSEFDNGNVIDLGQQPDGSYS